MLRICFAAFLVAFLNISCKKGFLDAKPSKSLLVPTTLADFDALLDNTTIFNFSCGLNEITSDDFYTTDDGWLGWYLITEKNAYIYADDTYQGISIVSDWDTPYQQVFYSNVVLDGLNKLRPGNVSQSDYNRVKGEALFQRAFAFYNLSQLFCLPYNKSTAKSDLGIPLRLNSDVNIKSMRATIEETYTQIINDIKLAQTLLPVNSSYKTRPNKRASDGLLARIYLSMQDYRNAETSANNALSVNNYLLDFNALDPASYNPFPQILPNNSNEVVFYSALLNYSFTSSPLSYVDPDLYRDYDDNDLRKSLFYVDNGSGLYNFKGSYGDGGYFFCGIANDELLLTKAEAGLRNGHADNALSDLNTLLLKRYKTGSFTNITTKEPNALLHIILKERRKELVGRGIRWSDLRRLNSDLAYAVTIYHTVQNITHTLAPMGKKYVFRIPDYEIKRSGIQQN